MDLEALSQLLVGGETFTTEFKTDPFNDAELVETVVCLANGSGGCLLVGVRDDGTVVGARRRHDAMTDPVRVRALIANRTDPAVVADVEVLTHHDGDVIVIVVPQARSVVGTVDGKFVRRAMDVRGKPQCLPMRPNEVVARAGNIGAQDFAALALPDASLADLSIAELDRLRRLAVQGGDRVLGELSDDDLLRAVGVVTLTGELSVAAVLMFGTEAASNGLFRRMRSRFK